jgi:hypothetical protein
MVCTLNNDVGAALTKIFLVNVSAQPPSVLTIKVTAWDPGVIFVNVGFCEVDVDVPISQLHEVMVPFRIEDASVNDAPPFAQIVVFVKEATGVLCITTVRVSLTGGQLPVAAGCSTRVTVPNEISLLAGI